MTFRKRLSEIEKTTGMAGVERLNCIYLCALASNSNAPADPRVAILLRGKLNDELSRLSDETADAFTARVELEL